MPRFLFNTPAHDWLAEIRELESDADLFQEAAAEALSRRAYDEVDAYLDEVAKIEQEVEHARKMFDAQMRRRQGVTKKGAPRKKRKPPTVVLPPPPEEEEEEELSGEWEFGFEYEAENGPRSNVDVNFRVRRQDGKPFSLNKAKEVMRYVRENMGDPPKGFVIDSVNWKHPSKAFAKEGTVEDLGNIGDSVVPMVSDVPEIWRGPWRVGAVKH